MFRSTSTRLKLTLVRGLRDTKVLPPCLISQVISRITTRGTETLTRATAVTKPIGKIVKLPRSPASAAPPPP